MAAVFVVCVTACVCVCENKKKKKERRVFRLLSQLCSLARVSIDARIADGCVLLASVHCTHTKSVDLGEASSTESD